jgi:hypothetical protein
MALIFNNTYVHFGMNWVLIAERCAINVSMTTCIIHRPAGPATLWPQRLCLMLCALHRWLSSCHSAPHLFIQYHSVSRNRHYKISAHRSASFVHRLLHVDPGSGQVILKRHLECDGLFYPNLFTLYVDSTSNETRGVDYYSLPLRIFIAGKQCGKEAGSEDRVQVKVSEAKRCVCARALVLCLAGQCVSCVARLRLIIVVNEVIFFVQSWGCFMYTDRSAGDLDRCHLLGLHIDSLCTKIGL